MFGYLEQERILKTLSEVGYVLIKHYDFDLQDMDRFLSLYARETNIPVCITGNMREGFEEWSKTIRNTHHS